MKIQIDTTNKTVTLTEDTNLNELFTFLLMVFPNDEWKEFTLKIEEKIQLIPSTPIVIDKTYPYPNQPYPWITYSTGSQKTASHLTDGVWDVNFINDFE